MFSKTLMLITISLLLSCSYAADAAAAKSPLDDLTKAWKLDFTGVSFDPNSWTNDIKTKMLMTGAICGVAISYAYKMSHVAMIGLFCFGLVKISWPLVGAIATALYGWKYNKKVFFRLRTSWRLCVSLWCVSLLGTTIATTIITDHDLPGIHIPCIISDGEKRPIGEVWTTTIPYAHKEFIPDVPTLSSPISTGKWVYVSRESPFCSIKVTYKVWITDSDDVTDFCSKELYKINCILSEVEVSNAGASIYIYKTKVVKCSGFRYSMNNIKENENWKEIFEYNNIKTLFGKFYMYHNQHRYFQLSYLFNQLALYYDDNKKQFVNAKFSNGRREYIDASWHRR